MGIVSGLGGALAVMARSFTYQAPVLTWTFAPLLVTAVLAFFVCLVTLAWGYHAQTCRTLPIK